MNEAFNTAGFEQRVRDRAYALWESEGRPIGRHAEHWRLSEEATRAEVTLPASAKSVAAKPASARKGARKRAPSRH